MAEEDKRAEEPAEEKRFESLAAWRASDRAGIEKTLPNSGLVVRLRRVSLLDLAEAGGIPAPLAGMVDDVLAAGTKAVSVEQFGKYADVINLVVRAAIVFPVIEDMPGENCLGVKELPMYDRIAIFEWANEGAQSLKKFRPKQR